MQFRGLKKNLRVVAASLDCARASAYHGCVTFWIEYAFNGFSPIFTDMSEVFSKAEDNRAPRAAARHPVPADLTVRTSEPPRRRAKGTVARPHRARATAQWFQKANPSKISSPKGVSRVFPCKFCIIKYLPFPVIACTISQKVSGAIFLGFQFSQNQTIF